MTKRQIFSLQKPNTPQVLSTFNFLSDQMTMNVTNKYGWIITDFYGINWVIIYYMCRLIYC